MDDIRGRALAEPRSQCRRLRENVRDAALSLLSLACVLGEQCGGLRIGAGGTSQHLLDRRHASWQVEGDDASVAWSPDGSQLLVCGGGGSYLVDTGSGAYQFLAYLTGYGSIAWLAT